MKHLKTILPLFLCLLAFAVSCKKDQPTEPVPKTFDKEAMLLNVGENSIVTGYETLLQDLKTARFDLTKFRDHKSLTTYVKARNSFEQAWKSWQKVSFYRFGPAESFGSARLLNLFPVDSSQVVFNLKKRSFNLKLEENQYARGFAAIDYLLNSHGSTQSMADFYRYDTTSAIRIQYMEDCYSLMIDNIDKVLVRWSPEGGDYLHTFATGGDGSIQELVTAFASGTEYLKTEKLARPAGLANTAANPFLQESYYGEQSLRLALAQIEGLRSGFFGNSTSPGLDDYLDHLNAKRDQKLLSKVIASAFDAAGARVDEIPEPFTTAIGQSSDKITAANAALDLLLEMLKVDVPAALKVEVAYEVGH